MDDAAARRTEFACLMRQLTDARDAGDAERADMLADLAAECLMRIANAQAAQRQRANSLADLAAECLMSRARCSDHD
jgi:hypothetical protein